MKFATRRVLEVERSKHHETVFADHPVAVRTLNLLLVAAVEALSKNLKTKDDVNIGPSTIQLDAICKGHNRARASFAFERLQASFLLQLGLAGSV